MAKVSKSQLAYVGRVRQMLEQGVSRSWSTAEVKALVDAFDAAYDAPKRARRVKEFRTVIQYAGEREIRDAYENADTAIGNVRRVYEHGSARTGEKPVQCRVYRVSDGKDIYNAVSGYEAPMSEWYPK